MKSLRKFENYNEEENLFIVNALFEVKKLWMFDFLFVLKKKKDQNFRYVC